jgi:hypothetical protein
MNSRDQRIAAVPGASAAEGRASRGVAAIAVSVEGARSGRSRFV